MSARSHGCCIVVKGGVKSISIVLVEPDDGSSLITAYKDFTYLLEKMKEIHGVDINYERFSHVDDVLGILFDVVYAIDYDDYCTYLDYSDRKLPQRTGDFGGSPYIASIGLIKAANLVSPARDSLIIMSHGKNIVSMTPEVAKSHSPGFLLLSQLNINLNSISEIYINADIGHININLEYLINAKKPLLINKAIIREVDVG